MNKMLMINGQEISYELHASHKTRHLRLEIGRSGLKVTKPWLLPDVLVEKFLKQKSVWILKTLTKLEKNNYCPETPPEDIEIIKKRAAKLLINRLTVFNSYYNFKYKRLTIRDQKTRWGSCSRRGALSFNYRLALVPESLLDYVAVHELCHLREMNHSDKFWNLVEQTIPDYKKRRQELKNYHFN